MSRLLRIVLIATALACLVPGADCIYDGLMNKNKQKNSEVSNTRTNQTLDAMQLNNYSDGTNKPLFYNSTIDLSSVNRNYSVRKTISN